MLRSLSIYLSLSILIISAAAVPILGDPARDNNPEFDLTGSLDVPTWFVGDYWNYTVDTSYDLGIVQIPLKGWINMSLEEVYPVSLDVFDPMYLMNITGNVTGKLDIIVSVRIYVDIDGYMLARMQDLANYIMVANITVSGTQDDLNGFYPFGYEYTPPLEEFDFPLIPGDRWSTDVTAGIPFSGGEGVDQHLDSECGDLTSIDVPAGTFDVLPIKVNGMDSLWFNESVGNCVKRQFLIETSGIEIDLPLELDTYEHSSAPLKYTVEVKSDQPVWAGTEFEVTGKFNSVSGIMSAIFFFPDGKLAATKLVTSSEPEFDVTLTAPMKTDNTLTDMDHGSLGILMVVYEGLTLRGYDLCTVTTKSTDLVVNETLVELEYERSGTVDDQFTARINVSNPSLFAAENFFVSVRIPGDELYNDTFGPYSLEANGTLSLDYPFRKDTPGNYTLELFADSDEDVLEYNETNNLFILNFTVNDRPTLTLRETPSEGEYIISEGETLSFNITSIRGNTSIPQGNWTVDGNNAVKSYNFDFITDYTGDRSSRMDPYIIEYALPPNSTYENETDSFSWRIFVVNVNRPPSIDNTMPIGPNATINEGQFIVFSTEVSDPDGDPINVSWTVDGIEKGNTSSFNFTSNYIGNGSSEGSPYEISLMVVDEADEPAAVYRNWTLTVIDVDRLFDYSVSPPEGDLELDINDALTLSFTAEDPDGDQVAGSWEYLGTILNGSDSITILPLDLGLEPGDSFSVDLGLVSGNFSAGVSWRILITGIINDTEDPEPEDIPPIGVVILSPGKGDSFDFGTNITVRAAHSDVRNISFRWTVNGEFLYGSEVIIPGLPSGNYTIVLNATSNDEVGGSLEIVSYFRILEEEEPPEEEDDPFYMYILAVIGFLAILMIVIFVLYLVIKGKGDEDEE